MTFRAVCLLDGQGLHEALEATHDFVNALSMLPHRPFESLQAIVTHGSPLVLAEALALSAALVCWLWYLLTRNCSHVDRMWSILPPIYVAIFARDDLAAAATAAVRHLSGSDSTSFSSSTVASGGSSSSAPLLLQPLLLQPLLLQRLPGLAAALAASGADPRLLLATALAAVWGCRLTYNFWRKGGYNLRYEDYR
ncbi:hypothetical protein Agub_g11049, partial [Astrephomene gubernaculifera]